MIIQFKKRTRGFGIIEVLISGVIIIIVLGALVILARNAINNSQYVQERSQAVNLAQEGIEIVRQIRDSSYIDSKSNTSWRSMVSVPNTDIDNNFEYNTPYYIGFNFSQFAMRFRLIKIPTSISLGGNTFYRTVSFTSIDGSQVLPTSPIDINNNGNNGVVVKVTVTWLRSTGEHKVELEELLTNSRFQF